MNTIIDNDKSTKDKSIDIFLSPFKMYSMSSIKRQGLEENACEFFFKQIYAFYSNAMNDLGCIFADYPISRLSTNEDEAKRRSYSEVFAFTRHFNEYFKTYNNIPDKTNMSISHIEFMNSFDRYHYKKYFTLPEGITHDNEVVEYFKREISKRLLIQTEKLTQKKRA